MKLIGHGIDLVDVRRIREYLEEERDDFELAWFTLTERETANTTAVGNVPCPKSPAGPL